MKETPFQSILVRKLRESGAEVLNLIPDERMGKNWPDLYIAHRMWNGWIELKSGTVRKVTPGQRTKIARLLDRDVAAIVLRLVEGFIFEEVYEDDVLHSVNDFMLMSLLEGYNGGAHFLKALQLL